MSTFSIYGARGPKEGIIISLETIFILYQERTLFNPTLDVVEFWINYREKLLLANKPSDS
jgi:hypothetical protein